MPRMFVLFLSGLVLTMGLSACGGGGASTPASNPISGGGGGSGSGGGGGGGSGDGDGDGGGGGEEPFVTAFRVLDVADPDGVYTTFLAEQNVVFGNAIQGGVTPMSGLLSSSNIPPSGNLDYEGYLILLVGNTDAAVGASITGETMMSVGVIDRTVSGSATGFLGKPPDENGVPQVVSYEGTIDFLSGTLTEGPGGEAAVSFRISGTLDDAVNTFVIDNTLSGTLFGPEGAGLNARQIIGGSNSTVNGAVASYDQATLRGVLQPAPP